MSDRTEEHVLGAKRWDREASNKSTEKRRWKSDPESEENN